MTGDHSEGRTVRGGTVAVVGAGISGLVAARELAKAGARVIVLDAAERSGGKLAGNDLGFDEGAEAMLARRPEAVGLVEELGLADRLVHPTPARASLWVAGRLRPVPRSVQGVPADPDDLAGLLSTAGLARLRAEPALPAPSLPGDVAIGDYLAQRCGAEVVDRLLEPLLGGVYAGHSRQLSFAAVQPALWQRVRTGGSVLEHASALLAATPAADPPPPVFAGLRGGVHQVVTALRDDLGARGAEVRTRATVRRVERCDRGFTITSGPVPAPRTEQVGAVLLAVPATPAGRLLTTLVPEAAAALAKVRSASTALLTLVVCGADLAGSGVLVPPGELPTVKALTHSSRKWAWIAEQAERRWGAGTDVVRVSIGRAGEAALLQVDDATLVQRSLAELQAHLPGWGGSWLRTARVRRWGGGLPQYAVGHVEAMREVREAVAEIPGLAVAGAYLDGVGLPACIASARAAAQRLIDGEGS